MLVPPRRASGLGPNDQKFRRSRMIRLGMASQIWPRLALFLSAVALSLVVVFGSSSSTAAQGARNAERCVWDASACPGARRTAPRPARSDPTVSRGGAARAEADRRRREELRRRQQTAPRATTQSQNSCPNRFGGRAARSGEYICSNVGELLACRCSGSLCHTIPTGAIQCTRPGAIVQ